MALSPTVLTARKTEPTRKFDPLGRLEQFYHAAKKAEWQVRDLSWDNLSPVPNAENERWNVLWSSVVQQQLQADIIAVEAAARLLVDVQEHEAKMYYSTMVQDEGRHCEAWKKLGGMLIDVEAHNPYLEEMGALFYDDDTLENRVIAFQVCFEGAAIYAFKQIADSTQNTILCEMATRLVRDDSIHHNSGVAYAHYLVGRATPSQKKEISKYIKQYAPLYIETTLWRPPARQWISRITKDKDQELLRRNQVLINRALQSLSIDPIFDI